jgi:recombination associated protein RdgC
MGVLSGSLTTTSYRVGGRLPDNLKERFQSQLKAHSFTPIAPSSDVKERTGWVGTHDPFDTDFQVGDVFWGEYVLFTMRRDTLAVSPSLFKIYLAKRLEEVRVELGLERLSKDQKDNAKEVLEAELRRKILPAIKLVDVAWSLTRKELWLFSGSASVRARFEEIFTRRFKLPLIARNAYAILERSGLSEDALEAAARRDPESFLRDSAGGA